MVEHELVRGELCPSSCSLLKLFRGTLVGVLAISVNVETVHDSLNIHILSGIRILPEGIPILFFHLFGRCFVINNNTPLSKIANVQILRTDIGTNVVNDKI